MRAHHQQVAAYQLSQAKIRIGCDQFVGLGLRHAQMVAGQILVDFDQHAFRAGLADAVGSLGRICGKRSGPDAAQRNAQRDSAKKYTARRHLSSGGKLDDYDNISYLRAPA